MRTSVVVSIVASIVAFSAGLEAQASIKRSTTIPPQDLAPALKALVQEREFQLIYSSELLADQKTQGATGELTLDEALQILLSDTGLTYQYVDDKTISIVPMSTQPPRSEKKTSTGAPLGAPNSTEQSSAGDQKKSFWSRFRIAQVDRSQGTSESADIAAAPSSSDAKLEEIVVTAQKRQERLLDVPQSVSVLSADALAAIGATQLRDFANTVPGLTLTTAGTGFTQISMRGVTTGYDISPTVGIYVDEVPYGSSSPFAQGARTPIDVALFDVDRIEVLRGPQGTLYGASALGGLIKYVSKVPNTKQFGVDLQTGLVETSDGGFGYNASAVLNAPLVADKAALRASGFYTHDGGYIDNVQLGRKDVNRANTYGGRVDLLLTPAEALTVRFSAFLQNISRNGEATVDYAFTGAPIDGTLDQRRFRPEPYDQRFRLVSGTVSYEFGTATLTSISSYQTTHMENASDISPAYVPIFATYYNRFYSTVGLAEGANTDKFTQEVRLSSAGNRKLEWVMGAFYNHETSGRTQVLLLEDLSGQPALNDLYNLSSPTRFREYAAFGDVTWYLTEKFDISGGLRFAKNDQDFTQNGDGVLTPSKPAIDSSEHVFTYLANARYRFSDQAVGYLRYATGYRPGAPNYALNDPSTGQPIANNTIDADRLKSYEAGIKAETSDRRYGVDLAGYYIDWSNIQILASSGGFSVNANARGGATVRGAELALTARPTQSLRTVGTFAWQNARISEADAFIGAAAHERLPNVPRFTAAIAADYSLQFGTLQPTIGASLRHVSARMSSFNAGTHAPQYRLPEYSMVDLRAGLTTGTVDWQLYIRNVFDKAAELSADNWRGSAQPAIAQPRTVGVSATVHF